MKCLLPWHELIYFTYVSVRTLLNHNNNNEVSSHQSLSTIPPTSPPHFSVSTPYFIYPGLAWLKSMLAGMYVSYGYNPTQPNPHPTLCTQKKKTTLYFVEILTGVSMHERLGWVRGGRGREGRPTNLFHYPMSVRFIIIDRMYNFV